MEAEAEPERLPQREHIVADKARLAITRRMKNNQNALKRQFFAIAVAQAPLSQSPMSRSFWSGMAGSPTERLTKAPKPGND